MKLPKVALLFSCTLLVAGCSSAPSATPGSSAEEQAGSYALVDFIRFEDVVYLSTNYGDTEYWPPGSAGIGKKVGRPLAKDDLGQKYAEVRFRASSEPTSDRRDDNGTAARHAPNTPVYTVKGYDPSFRLAIRQGERLVLYEAVRNPRAQNGSDFLDISGRVSHIGVMARSDKAGETTLAREPQEVKAFVSGLTDAPLERKDSDYFGRTSSGCLIVFHLKDGTAVIREYRSDSGLLSPGIETPQGFEMAVERVL